jgi:5-formyltetrahydrofolate cyclo-ligase
MDDDLAAKKKTLRTTILAQRTQLSPAQVQTHGAAIADLVLASPVYLAAHTICCYMAFQNEAPTAAILRAALAAKKRVLLPRTLAATRELVLHQIDDLADLYPGRYGILEPSADAPIVSPAAVELFIVPGAVFDRNGNRIGYGAGYYDSVLALSSGCRMALAYSFQLEQQLPCGPHDIPMDLLVTEHGMFRCPS